VPVSGGVNDSERIDVLPVPAARLGESPLWHPEEAALYWVDIDGCALHRWQPGPATHTEWSLGCEPGSAAPLLGGGLLLAQRDGLWHFDTERGTRGKRLASAPFEPADARFNDGKADPQGRFWVGSIHQPRDPARSALYRWTRGKLARVVGDVATSNGLAWSPDGRTMYWSDTAAHRVRAFDFDPVDGSLSRARAFVQFTPKADGDGGNRSPRYGGRPDGAAVDVDGSYWVAMYEGARLLRISHDGTLQREITLPVRCPTMPCFGDADGRTLYLTTAAPRGADGHRTDDEPLAGCVLQMRVEVPGLPTNFVRP
jgi:sugar lactone lactonase YvrE